MADTIQAIRGMNDILPTQTPRWQQLESCMREVLQSYCYAEIRMPIVESTRLFKRSIGEATDIVEKEMYTFEDRNQDSLSLRPEGTASCVRAALQNGLLHNQIQRLWYMGPMFRHERPQKGRYRQFHQIGVEAFGMQGPDIDAELILMTARLWQRLGIQGLRLEINSLGSAEARHLYRDKLVEYFSAHQEQLDEDSQRRLHRNPLRILDSKNRQMQALINQAPVFADYLDPESAEHFATLLRLLDGAGVEYTVNPRLVRGLDYYCKTVFEWITDSLGAQGTVCAGGRYDGLVEHFGGKPTPAVGFAMGLERLVAMLEDADAALPDAQPDVYLISMDEADLPIAMQIAETLRSQIPGLRLLQHCGAGSFKSQIKKADKSGATLALLMGETERQNNSVSIKYLREEQAQHEVPVSELSEYLKKTLKKA